MTEISQIILVLLDSRCPLVHYPPALSSYLSGIPYASRTRIILVLTKVDVVGPARADAWAAYLREKHPGVRVVQVESYADPGDALSTAQGKKKIHEAHLPSTFRHALVEALKAAHAELLTPPEYVRNDAEKLARWKPRVLREVDWTAVLEAEGERVGSVVVGATAPRSDTSAHTDEARQTVDLDEARSDDGERDGKGIGLEEEPEFLTIGLIGLFSPRSLAL